MSEDPTNLTANFQCLYAPDFELGVELKFKTCFY